MTIRAYRDEDLPAMIRIWNQVVIDGISFPQEECLDEQTGAEFFGGQSHCGVAVLEGETQGVGGCAPAEDAPSVEDEPFAEDAPSAKNEPSTGGAPAAAPDSHVVGLYILHPNNIGRCGHLANASYAVDEAFRGLHIGEKLVQDSLVQAKRLGFQIMQFNAVLASNTHARHLYERLGFQQLGVIPAGFRLPDGSYVDICPYYRTL